MLAPLDSSIDLSSWRYDPLSDCKVRIAPARANRPNDFASDGARRKCPFCAGSESVTPPEVERIDDERGHWLMRAVPNQFPAVDDEAGAQEVIIESPRHVQRYVDLEPAEATAAVTAWARRLRHWLAEGRFDYALVFKNEGSAAGASLQHVHSQLLALPKAPERAASLWRRRSAGASSDGEHPVAELSGWRVVVPDASRFAFETWLRPMSDGPSIHELADGQGAAELAALLRKVIASVTELSGQDSYNVIVQVPPASFAAEHGSDWWIEVVPRTSAIAGLELATGLWVSAVPPEDAARLLTTKLSSTG